MEQWRPVQGHEGSYEVSDHGRVRSLDRQCGERLLKGRVLSDGPSGNGYRGVRLWKDGKQHSKLVHRLVAAAFVPARDEADQVNHLDGNKAHNAASNLEWCTAAENAAHAEANGLTLTPEDLSRRSKRATAQARGRGRFAHA